MSTTSPLPIPSDTPTAASCPSCGAPLAADQRYCLACGQPCSPVRLAFLDVLQAEQSTQTFLSPVAPAATALHPAYSAGGYPPAPPPPDQSGMTAWLHRNSGILSLLTVLLLAVLAGLLIGHWVSQGKTTPGVQVLRVEYPNGAPAVAQAAAPTTTTAAGASTSNSAAAASEPKSEAAEVNETKEAEHKPPPPPVKASTKSLQSLASSKGRQHQHEIERLTQGNTPIETGGGSSGSTPAKTPSSKAESGKAGGGSGFQTIE